MAKLVKNFCKNITKSYFEGLTKLYEPCIKNGIYPFM